MARLTQKTAQGTFRPARPETSKAARRPAPAAHRPAFLQAKLAVSHPHDADERQADQVAAEVSRTPRGVQRASLEPGITPEKREQSLAPKPVPSAARIAPKESSTVGEQAVPPNLMRQEAEEEAIQARLYRQAAPGETQQPRQKEMPQNVADQTLDGKTEARIDALKGHGAPLPEAVLADMEAQFGRDFTGVRIHVGSEAAELCSQVQARAFTVGKDVFFAPGEYAPDTEAGRELLAHELTHVAQQESSLRRLQRNNPPPAAGSAGGAGGPGGAAGGGTATPPPVIVTELPIPHFKYASGRYQSANLFKAKEYDREGSNATYQAHTWDRSVNPSGITGKLRDTVGMIQPEHTYMVVSNPRNLGSQPVGDAATVAGGLLRPWWTPAGHGIRHEVDHIVELQLSGWPRVRTADQMSNYELVDRDSNGASGRQIDQSLVAAVRAAMPGTNPRDVMRTRDVIVSSVSDSGTLANAGRWTKEDIEQGRHIDTAVAMAGGTRPVEFWDLDDPTAHGHFSAPHGSLNTENYKGSSNKFVIYYRSTGGSNVALNYASAPAEDASPVLNNPRGLFIHGLQVDSVVFNRTRADRSEPVGVIRGRVFKQQSGGRVYSQLNSVNWNVRSMATSDYAGYLDAADLRNLVSFHLGFMSPIRFDSIDVDPDEGLVARGKVLPSLPLFRDADIDIVFAGEDVRLEKYFPIEELHLPPPIQVDTCNLGVSLGTQSGLRLSGNAEFSVERLGRGSFSASVGTTGENASLTLEGQFDFDTDLFDRATVRAWYRNEQFGLAGAIGIDRADKIRGIRAANLQIQYQEGQLTANGTVDPDIPGVQQAGLRLGYSEAQGLTIGGRLQLAEIPGIRSGAIDVTVNKRDDAWRVAATGEAQPAIPGIDSSLRVSYDNGAFTAELSGAFRRGMLSGQVTAGVTNRSVGEDGQPAGEPAAGAPLVVYGSGSATVQIAPWLQGTAGVRFAPNGEVTVSGQIGLPSQIELFPRKEIRRDIFSIDIPIPIVPGIFAEVGGGLDAHAGIGPGVIDRLQLGIEYNPAHEENTHVTGDGHVNVPADAGLRLSVHGGIGLGIPAASVSGGLEVGGELGLQGAAEAGVHVDWMPSQGLAIDAYGRLSAHPRFVFDVSGYVEVEALFFTIYENRWRLAAFEYGSDLTFGVTFPIRYREGEPFDIALEDVEFQVPDVSPRQILGDLVERIV